jgi:predicted DNA-binding WGR domain protein
MTPAPVLLQKIDRTRNMARFYRLEIRQDLLGDWCLTREWGRIGCAGQRKIAPFPSSDEARAARDRFQRTKERRGYVTLAAF